MSKASTSSQTLTGADKKLDWRAMLHAMQLKCCVRTWRVDYA